MQFSFTASGNPGVAAQQIQRQAAEKRESGLTPEGARLANDVGFALNQYLLYLKAKSVTVSATVNVSYEP